MNAISRWGVLSTFVGFLVVGSAVIYSASVSAQSPPTQDLIQSIQNASTAQGVGWILVGIGLAMALSGLSMDLHDLKTVVPDISALDRSPPPLLAHKVPKTKSEFVCSDCGGEISEDDKTCPHCGAPIEEE